MAKILFYYRRGQVDADDDPEYKIGRPRQLFTGAVRRDVTPLAQR